jgi:YHS domain-containing protein
MGILSFLLRALFVLIFVRLLGLVLRALFAGFRAGIADPPAGAPAPPRDPAGTPRSTSIEEMRRDPVCGVHVAASAAVAGRFNGEEAFFCSAQCAAASTSTST